LAPGFFSDGFHLNPDGAAIFTARLLDALQAMARD
jgi:lysophospholipase L1-like esterase